MDPEEEPVTLVAWNAVLGLDHVGEELALLPLQVLQ
jgi:hypothetical protein